MFIVERLIGVTVYILCLIIVFFLIGFTNAKVKNVLRIYVIFLAILAFFYEPYTTADLYRINKTMLSFSKIPFNIFFRKFVITSSVPVARLIYWCIGKTGILRLLPMLNVGICYSIFFSMVDYIAKQYKVSRLNVAITILFFMSIGHFMSTISNVRTMLAVALISWCFFRETYKNKFSWWHIAVYMIAALIHNLAVVLIIVRVLSTVLNVHKKMKIKIILTLFGSGFSYLFMKYGSNITEDIFEKMKYYLTGGYSYIWEYFIGILIVSCILYILYKKQSRITNDYEICLILCQIISICSVSIFSIFYRFASVIIPVLIIPTLMLTLENSKREFLNKGKSGKLGPSMIMTLMSIVILVLSCTRGSMCSYKFFEL